MQTITPSDYTAYYEIHPKAFTYFKNIQFPKYQKKYPNVSIGESLKSYMKKELERILTEKLSELRRN